MDEQKKDPAQITPLEPGERGTQSDSSTNNDKVLNLDTNEYEDAKEDMKDDESIMDFGSGSGGGSAGDGAGA